MLSRTFTPYPVATQARALGCYACTHFHGRFLAEHVVCENRGGVQVIGTPCRTAKGSRDMRNLILASTLTLAGCATVPVPAEPATFTALQCESIANILGALAEARDVGIDEVAAQKIWHDANAEASDDAPDKITNPQSLAWVRHLVAEIYAHPERSAAAVHDGNLEGCMRPIGIET